MGYIHDLSEPFVPPHFCRAVPGPVRDFQAHRNFWGHLVLEWRPPAGGGAVAFYRLERTREGRVYETLAELPGSPHVLKHAPLHKPWFYRIVGVNARGPGRAVRVWLFQRLGNGLTRLLPVPVRPGLRVGISVLEPMKQAVAAPRHDSLRRRLQKRRGRVKPSGPDRPRLNQNQPSG